MKLTTLIMILAIMQVSAVTHAQKVTLSVQNTSLATVFQELRSQTGYDFVYTSKELKDVKLVTINVKNQDLKDVLDQIAANQPIVFSIEDQVVVVSKKDPSLIDKVKAYFAAIDVTAKIVDELNEPLAGATVKVGDEKSIRQSTTTDKDGKFFLRQVDPDAQVTITFIGFEPQTMRAKDIVNGSSITLKASSTNLHEVVINKGYYSEKEMLSTGDATTITAKTIGQQPVENPILALEGRVPGLQITQSSGISGSGISVVIRGQNSITQSKDPLYIVDGVQYNGSNIGSNITLGQSPLGSGQLNPLSFLNPQDIESITVLKDADAISIYGSRGSNGVILINTKKGRSGQMQVDLNFAEGAGHIDNQLQLMNTSQYLAMRKQAFINDGISDLSSQPAYFSVDLTNWSQSAYTNWEKQLIGGTADYINAQASLSGGSTNTQFLVSGSYHRNTTVYPMSFANQTGGLHFSLDNFSNNQKFKMSLVGSYIINDNRLPGSDLTPYIFTPPNAPSYLLSNGQLDWADYGGGNPYHFKYHPFNSQNGNLLGSINLSYELTKGLNFGINSAYNNIRSDQSSLTLLEYNNPAYNPTGSNTFETDWISTININPQFNYKTKIGKGELSALLGANYEYRFTNGFGANGSGYTQDALVNSLAAATSVYAYNTPYEQYKTFSPFIGQLKYSWDDSYILNLTGRRDGSSRFGPDKKFGNFGAVGAAWVFSNQIFIKRNLPWLSFGKLRGSYGTSGNEPGLSYQFLELYQPSGTGTNLFQGGAGLAPINLPASTYSWEVDKKLEGGIELGFFNNRINFSASLYRNRTGNQLVPENFPSAVGLGTLLVNLPATVQNSGVELELNTININNNGFKWTTQFSFTHNANKLVSFPDLQNSTYNGTLIIGQPIDIKKVFRYSGINTQTGIYQFYTASGQLTSSPLFGTDQTKIINTDPKFFGGIGNTFSYNKFRLDVFFQFQKQLGINPLYGSANLFPGVFYSISSGIGYGNLPVQFINNTWTPTNTNAQFQRLTATEFGETVPANVALRNSDFLFTDASFLRLTNAALSYNFSGNWLKTIGVRGLRVFVNGQNLWVLSHYKGLDPENQSISALPLLRVITGGLEVKL